MRRPRSRAGQIIIPAMLIFPTLFLFVYLIYETAKLSREKIRHQFAMDAAVYVEMANYSDFLNRSAYVNGAFPMRIFEEGYGDFPTDPKVGFQQLHMSYATLLFNNGAFPHLNGTFVDGHTAEGNSTFQPLTSWPIAYGYVNDGAVTSPGPQTNRPADGINENPPEGGTLKEPYVLFSLNDAKHYYHSYELAAEIYKLWVQVYSLLGSVEGAQYSVLNRLTTGPPAHSFLVKSYWLNTSDPVSDGNALAASFDNQLNQSGNFNTAVGVSCQKTLVFCGNTTQGGTMLQPLISICTNPIVQLLTTAGCDGNSIQTGAGGGLFQLVYVKQGAIDNLMNPHAGNPYRGLSLSMNWTYPASNYFNVNWTQQGFSSAGPKLHTTISLAGNNPAVNGITPAVWPDPTPKFQVRQFP